MLKLNTTSLSHVPLHKYDKNFTFNVNGKSYYTSRIVADLLSPKICKNHFNDITINDFTIDTHQDGNFSYFLDLVNFSQNDIPKSEIPFILEVIEILGCDSIEFSDQNNNTKITTENVFELIQQHELNEKIFSKQLQEEIDFISSHFTEFSEEQEEKLEQLQIETLERIFSNPKLQLNTEDQLLKLINHLYLINPANTILYEKVEFSNVSANAIKDFLDVFNVNDMTNETWRLLSFRLEQEIIKPTKQKLNARYNGISIPFKENGEFNGIINYLRNNIKASIYDIINITASSGNNNKFGNPKNSIIFEDLSKDFRTNNSGDVWICFDFKSYRIIPSNYSIRSYNFGKDYPHPRSWVIEGSNDGEKWTIIDEQKDCSFLNGQNLVHTFTIQNSNCDKFQFIRLRQTGPNWENNRQLSFNSIEFYGKLY